MLHRFRAQFGTAGMVVAIVALVAALAGGAYAASGALNGKQKKEVTKIAKKYAGKPGAPGAAGPAGPKGDAGPAGSNGTNGTNGKDGTSVTGVAATAGECSAGGVKYTSASGTNIVCNGENGTTGFTETLPSGKTETGTWAMGPIVRDDVNFPGNGQGILIPISFPIPLAAPLEACAYNFGTSEFEGQCQVHVILANGKEVNAAFEEIADSPFCPGDVAEPDAEPGNFCLYIGKEEHIKIYTFNHTQGSFWNPATGEQGVATSGLALEVIRGAATPASEKVLGMGTWAVTAE
jgi:hypothetical protein